MENLPDLIWQCDDNEGSDDGATTSFTGLDAGSDHILVPVPAGPG